MYLRRSHIRAGADCMAGGGDEPSESLLRRLIFLRSKEIEITFLKEFWRTPDEVCILRTHTHR
jgi:hypothetical protein